MNRRAFLIGAAALPIVAAMPARAYATGGFAYPSPPYMTGERGMELFVSPPCKHFSTTTVRALAPVKALPPASAGDGT